MIEWICFSVVSILLAKCLSGSTSHSSLDEVIGKQYEPYDGPGPRILIAGMGYGTSEQVDAWTVIQAPYSLGRLEQELLRAGVAKVRHVFGWPILVEDKPGHVALLYNDPGRGQDAVTKGLIGNITPLGGKVEWEKLAAHGFTLARAYLATAGMELDELDGPNSKALELLNSFPGLRYEVFASPNGKTLYLNGKPVMHFERTKGGVEYKVTLTEYGKNLQSYTCLDDLIVTYAIGLHPLDRESKGTKKGRPVATAVINVWPTKLWNFIRSLKLGAEATAKGAKGIMAVPIRELGSKYRTTVSNLVALALVGYNPALYKKLTGREMPKEMPSAREIYAMRKTIYAKGASINDIIKMFDEQHPYVAKEEKEEQSVEKKEGEKRVTKQEESKEDHVTGKNGKPQTKDAKGSNVRVTAKGNRHAGGKSKNGSGSAKSGAKK